MGGEGKGGDRKAGGLTPIFSEILNTPLATQQQC